MVVMTFASLVLVLWFSGDTHVIGQFPIHRAPYLLADDAEKVFDQLGYVRERALSGDRLNRLTKDELALELDSFAARVSALRAELERLRYLNTGL